MAEGDIDVDREVTIKNNVTKKRNTVGDESNIYLPSEMSLVVEESIECHNVNDKEGGEHDSYGEGKANENGKKVDYIGNEVDYILEEERIIRITKLINDRRNRACYQSILDFGKRENKMATMEIYKRIIDNLVAKNIFTNKGSDGKESFKVVKERTVVKDVGSKETNNDQHMESLKSLEHYLDDQFYTTLKQMIKKEVNSSFDKVKYELKVENSKVNPILRNDKEIDYLNDLIVEQKKDIEFLRKEILSKDKIIQMLITDKNNDERNKGCAKNVVAHIIDQNINGEIKSTDAKKDGIQNKKRSIAIIGDSIIKDIEQHKVSQALGNREKVFVKSFSGAKINHMKSYVIPTKEFDNDLLILHCGTNDLRSGKKAHDIAKEIFDLAIDIKNEKNDVMVSAIVPRRDFLNEKGMEVNSCLKNLCSNHNIHFIDHANVKSKYHLNGSGLHLNIDGTYIVGSNFVNALKL